MKTCSRCQRTLTDSEFYVRRKKGEVVGLQARCKACMREYKKEWAEANPQRVKYHDRRKSLKGRYGDDAADRYPLLFEAQGGVCAICAQPERVKNAHGAVIRLAVDHDHQTGEVRGLLCYVCNQALGRMGDSIEGVRRWLDYLENPPNARLPDDLGITRWTPHYSACMECETTSVPHGGDGLCRNCYMRKARRDGKSWAKDGRTWEERKQQGALSPSKRPKKGKSPAE